MAKSSKVLFFVSYEGEHGELEGFFDEDKEPIACWCLNDAHWRSEYMDSLLTNLGYTVDYIFDNDSEMTNKLLDWFGFDSQEDTEVDGDDWP